MPPRRFRIKCALMLLAGFGLLGLGGCQGQPFIPFYSWTHPRDPSSYTNEEIDSALAAQQREPIERRSR